MSAERTLILNATGETAPSQVDRLMTNLDVGGVALAQIIGPDTVVDLTERRGEGFSELQVFRDLFASIGRRFGESQRIETEEAGSFMWDHDWHLSVLEPNPTVRLWLHLRGQASFLTARAATYDTPGGYGFCDEEVEQAAHMSPAVFRPEPGDALIFIDRGCRDVTGTSTFHKVDIPKWDILPNRLSVACDVSFPV